MKVAIEASMAAANIIRNYYKGSFEVSIKEDQTPVTQVDIECEQAIKKILLSAFPEHGFFGEESALTKKEADLILESKVLDSLKRTFNEIKSYNTSYFPNDIRFNWNEDNFGPIVIPEKNNTIELNKNNLPIYKKIIREYEKNELTLDSDGIIRINNVETSSYTFKQDYYWMMGDNRYKSEDSRSWGFVPEDHIVGKPVFIWFSIDGINDGFKNWKIRWDRVFTTINLDGEPKSYRWYFLIGVLIVLIYSEIKKRRK